MIFLGVYQAFLGDIFQPQDTETVELSVQEWIFHACILNPKETEKSEAFCAKSRGKRVVSKIDKARHWVNS